jgi:hypothetical protein
MVAIVFLGELTTPRHSLAQSTPRNADSAALPLCGKPFWILGKAFPRVIHIGMPPLGPGDTLVSERTNRAFIPFSGAYQPAERLHCRSSITTVEATTGRLIRTVPLGLVSPVAAVDDRANRVVVAGYPEGGPADWSQGALTVLDTQGRIISLPRTFALCPCPGATTYGLAIGMDGRTHRVFVGSSHRVVTFDTISGRLLNSVPVETGDRCDCLSLVVDERRGRVFATTSSGLTVFSAASGSVREQINLPGPPGFVAEDRRTGRIFTEALTGPSGCRGGPSYVLAVLDATTSKLIRAMFDSCSGFGVAVDEPARRAYIREADMNQVAVLDSGNGRVLRYLSPRDPPPPVLLAVGPRTGRLYYLYVRCSTRACEVTIKVFDSARRRVLRALHIPQGVPILRGDVFTTIADAAGRVFVTNPQARTVTMLQVGP